jgi:hypothetical protein
VLSLVSDRRASTVRARHHRVNLVLTQLNRAFAGPETFELAGRVRQAALPTVLHRRWFGRVQVSSASNSA